jgi:hypothetical protein
MALRSDLHDDRPALGQVIGRRRQQDACLRGLKRGSFLLNNLFHFSAQFKTEKLQFFHPVLRCHGSLVGTYIMELGKSLERGSAKHLACHKCDKIGRMGNFFTRVTTNLRNLDIFVNFPYFRIIN